MELLNRVCGELRALFPRTAFEAFADNSPVREVTAAVRAGLGVRGKNHLLIHPAYTEYGNDRLSCALCVFACDKDLRNGAMNRPDLAERYMKVEEKSGFTFRYKHSLKEILREL